MTDEEFKVYYDGLVEGEEVIETCQTSCMHGMRGHIYISQNKDAPSFGHKCVLWSNKMGTSVTHGTRRIGDVPGEQPSSPYLGAVGNIAGILRANF